MKVPSFRILTSGLTDVSARFPLPVAATVVATICAMLMIEQSDLSARDFLLRLLLCSHLAFLIYLTVALYAETHLKNTIGWYYLGSTIALVLIFFLFEPVDLETQLYRYLLLAASFHFLVAISPFIGKSDDVACWRFNIRMAARFLTAVLYSIILYGGLALGIASTNLLFDLDISSRVYEHLIILVFIAFNTLFFLAGLPRGWEEQGTGVDYPKFLRLFTQYVLIPLATVYLLILLSYEIKLILQASLPRGRVSGLILGYAVCGLLTVLLLHPVQNDSSRPWVFYFLRFFYFTLIPLVVLMGLSIYARIDQYGFTEERYIVLMLFIWLIGLTLYYIIRRKHGVKIIPASLAVLCLLATWGPQSASAVSARSQTLRLIDYFKKNHAFQNGFIVPIQQPTDDGEALEILRFINLRYGMKPLQRFASINLDSLIAAADTVQDRNTRTWMRLEKVRSYYNLSFGMDSPAAYLSASSYPADSLSVTGFSYFVEVDYPVRSPEASYQCHADSIRLTLYWKNQSATFDLGPVLHLIRENRSETNPYITFRRGDWFCDDPAGRARLIIHNISFRLKEQHVSVESMNGWLMVR